MLGPTDVRKKKKQMLLRDRKRPSPPCRENISYFMHCSEQGGKLYYLDTCYVGASQTRDYGQSNSGWMAENKHDISVVCMVENIF